MPVAVAKATSMAMAMAEAMATAMAQKGPYGGRHFRGGATFGKKLGTKTAENCTFWAVPGPLDPTAGCVASCCIGWTESQLRAWLMSPFQERFLFRDLVDFSSKSCPP